MFVWFVLGCLVAGTSIGIFAYVIVNAILLTKLQAMAVVAEEVGSGNLSTFGWRCR